MASDQRVPAYEPAQFLNVDLEIGARGKLAPLIAELAPRLLELHRGKIGALNRVHYEIGVYVSDADSTMQALIEALQQLTPAARRIWDRAELRDFNIGIQGGLEPGHTEIAVATRTLAQVVALGGRLVVTVYPPCPAKPDLHPRTNSPTRKRRAATSSSARSSPGARRH
ncbi:MAG TPA: hypothetical protein VGD80_41970 [Kofleriaceae bacterium]